MLDIQKMTEKTREALAAAGAAAREYGHQEIRPIHLLSALAHQEGGLLPSLLKRIGTPNSLLSGAVEAELAKLPTVTGNAVDVYPSRDFSNILVEARNRAEQMKDEYISVEHLLMAMIDKDAACAAALEKAGLTADTLLKTLVEIRGNQRVTNENPEASFEAL